MVGKGERIIEKGIRKATDENSVYHRAAKPYLDAVRILKQAENYADLDEIKAMYPAAAERIAN